MFKPILTATPAFFTSRRDFCSLLSLSIMPAVHKCKVAPVHTEPALQLGEPVGDNRAELHSLTAVALGCTCKQSRSRGSAGQFLTALMGLCRIATYLHLPRCLVPSKTATRTQGMGSGMESKLKQQWPQAPGRAVGVPPRAED